jgi:hypothetical protein
LNQFFCLRFLLSAEEEARHLARIRLHKDEINQQCKEAAQRAQAIEDNTFRQRQDASAALAKKQCEVEAACRLMVQWEQEKAEALRCHH